MKRLFKKMIPIVALLIVCTTVLACMSGCLGKDDSRFDTDLFCCMYNEDKTGVIILELTEKGQEQEILVIPEEINGLPVVQLGGTTMGYPYNLTYRLKSEMARKIYIFKAPLHISGKLFFPNATVVLFDIGEEGQQQYASVLSGYIQSNKVVYSFELIEDEWIYKEDFSKSYTANMLFFVNEELCYADYIEEEGVYLLPQDYDATISDIVWYKDLNYSEKWDNRIINQNDVLKLYGKKY